MRKSCLVKIAPSLPFTDSGSGIERNAPKTSCVKVFSVEVARESLKRVGGDGEEGGSGISGRTCFCLGRGGGVVVVVSSAAEAAEAAEVGARWVGGGGGFSSCSTAAAAAGLCLEGEVAK